MSRYAHNEPWNDRLEIDGDTLEEVRDHLERIAGYEDSPFQPVTEEEVDEHYTSWEDDNPEDSSDEDLCNV
jgi:hypothetical protein